MLIFTPKFFVSSIEIRGQNYVKHNFRSIRLTVFE